MRISALDPRGVHEGHCSHVQADRSVERQQLVLEERRGIDVHLTGNRHDPTHGCGDPQERDERATGTGRPRAEAKDCVVTGSPFGLVNTADRDHTAAIPVAGAGKPL